MSDGRTKYIVGVDLGGTNIVVGAMPEDGSKQLAVRQAFDALGARRRGRGRIASRRWWRR